LKKKLLTGIKRLEALRARMETVAKLIHNHCLKCPYSSSL